MSVTVKDRGWGRIKREVRSLERRSIKVGVRAGPANDGVQVVDYGAIQEFGAPGAGIPSRPWMRRTADMAHPDLNAFARSQLNALYSGAPASQMLDRIGLWYRARMQATVRAAYQWATPLSSVTVTAKGSSAPLIDQGILINSIDYQVR